MVENKFYSYDIHSIISKLTNNKNSKGNLEQIFGENIYQ